MSKFSVVLTEEVREYKRFYWRVDWDEVPRFLVKLVGMKLTVDGVQPIYLPVFSIEKRAGQIYFSIQFDRWRTLEIIFDRFGIHPHWTNLKEEYEQNRMQQHE